jgi:hypothetical protein
MPKDFAGGLPPPENARRGPATNRVPHSDYSNTTNVGTATLSATAGDRQDTSAKTAAVLAFPHDERQALTERAVALLLALGEALAEVASLCGSGNGGAQIGPVCCGAGLEISAHLRPIRPARRPTAWRPVGDLAARVVAHLERDKDRA